MSDRVVGIDLGTSNSVVAVIEGQQAHVIPDAEGRRVHPSVVSFHPNGSVLVGEEAVRRRAIDPANTIYSAKRFVGRTFLAGPVQAAIKRAAFKIVEGPNQHPVIVTRGQTYTIPEILAFVLRYLRDLASAYTGDEISRAVITVPANFDDAQREATRDAGQIAGFDVLRIVNEPTAAALAYGYGQGMDARIAVYDFGGGTFDTTILQIDDKVFEVLSTAGDPYLGGDDIDDRVIGHMVSIFLEQNRVDLSMNLPVLARLRQVAESIKCQLSSRPKALVQVQEVATGADGQPLHLSFSITRDQLNQMARDLVQRSFLICDEALKLSGLTVTQIDEVVLVGGTTKMPLVRDGVLGYFGREPRADINPDEVVAVGAAIQAAALASTPDQAAAGSVLLDVTPRALGLAVVGGYTDFIIERNAQIPVEEVRRFTTSQDNQVVVRIQVCQGESIHFGENQPLGELVLDGLRAAPRGEVEVEVTFEINTDGILRVRARDLETELEQHAQIQVLGTLSEQEVADLAAKHADLPEAVPEEEAAEEEATVAEP
jgi:molecular chaperone DnaK